MIRTSPISIFRGWIFCMAAFAAPSVAQADCAQWAIGEIQIINQTNGYTVQFNTKQSGTDFHGIARSYPIDESGNHGLVDGSIRGDELEATVTWANGSVGAYTGRVLDNGYLSGITHDEVHPESRASWESQRYLDCLTSAQAPQAPPAPHKSTSIGGSPPVVAMPPAPPKPFEALPPGGTGNLLKQMKP